MLEIQIPNNNINERKYIIEIIFDEILEISYKLIYKPSDCSLSIKLNNGRSLEFNDHFFNKFHSYNSYLKSDNIPSKVEYVSKKNNYFIPENNIPIIFGNSQIEISKNKIICGIDIVASSFFMLARWEETVINGYDKHIRFPASASLAYKAKFLKRPIVNEYIEMLWNMLTYLGINQDRNNKPFRAIISHDIDFALQWRDPFVFAKKIGGDILKRKSIYEAKKSISSFIGTKTKRERDPFDTFDFLMDSSESQDLRSHFFFLCGGKTKYDKGHLPASHPFIIELLKKIDLRGHIIGFHPSYNTFDDPQLFKHELETLQRYSPQDIKCGRQHFLRFKVPSTWQNWEENRFQWESSMYYSEEPGFRCGTCNAFPVFDVINRKKLKLYEVPLTAMDVSWMKESIFTPIEMEQELLMLLDKTKKYSGTFVFLWHNSTFKTPEYTLFNPVYESFLSKI